MTSNERKILECLWNHGGEVHVHLISSKTGFSSDYSLFLCRSLEKAGHLEFINPNICQALSSILSDDEDESDEDAAQETEENVSGNDVDICISMTEHTEHNEEGIEKFGEI